MEFERVRFVSNGSVKQAVVSEKADFRSRRESYVNIVNIDQEEERTQDSTLRDSRNDRTGV